MTLLVTAPLLKEDIEKLKTKFRNIEYRPWTLSGKGSNAEEMLNMLKETNAKALITELDDINSTVLDAHHDLMFIGDCRANPVNIDVQVANKYKIPIIYTPARNAQAVAELLVGSLINFLRNVQPAIKWLEESGWQPGHSPYYRFMGNEICGKKVGFVGFGAVGQKTARILSAFDAEINYYDPYVQIKDYEKQKIQEIFMNCDFVSVHLPVLPSTRGMVNQELLGLMKHDAVFINTARSAVVDMKALYALLKENKIKGAVLDVYDYEPPQEDDYKIIMLPNVLATPHICGATHEVADHQSNIITMGIMKWFQNEDLKSIVFNKEVLD